MIVLSRQVARGTRRVGSNWRSDEFGRRRSEPCRLWQAREGKSCLSAKGYGWTIVQIQENRVRLGITAPRAVSVRRREQTSLEHADVTASDGSDERQQPFRAFPNRTLNGSMEDQSSSSTTVRVESSQHVLLSAETPETERETKSASDDVLAEHIASELRATGYLHLHDLQITARCGVVVLRGRVPSYYLKQLAQTTAMAVSDVRDLKNEITVVCPR